VGPLAATPEDLQLAFEVISGHDPKDATSVEFPPPPAARPISGLRIGLPREFFSAAGIDPETLALVRGAAARLEKLGARLTEVALPSLRYAVPAYHILASAEAASNLGRFDGLRYGSSAEGADLAATYARTRGLGFGREVKRRIMLGTYALGSANYEACYAKARRVRALITRDLEAAFEKADFLITPTAPAPAFRFGEKDHDPVAMYLSDIFTIPCSLAGSCGASAPAGRTAAGLPAGAQFLGPRFSEPALFALLKEFHDA
jgi:aspartyl-tRNA(Asn)/glutamyl-tRNA(Gln) amidotransferase subunit A